jgi:hypothetical protein
MSDINGTGYGDKHNWFRLATHGRDSIHMECLTEYECIDCKAYFRHFYNRPGQDDIFEAMRLLGVKEVCGE